MASPLDILRRLAASSFPGAALSGQSSSASRTEASAFLVDDEPTLDDNSLGRLADEYTRDSELTTIV